MSSEYWKLLQRPEWQRKRLEVFQRADFKCEECGATDNQLHAHHKIYRKGRDPWEYDLGELACPCDACHERWHMLKNTLMEALAALPMEEISRLAGFAIYCIYRTGKFSCARISSEAALDGMSKGCGVDSGRLRALLEEDGTLQFQDVTDAAKAGRVTKKGKRHKGQAK